MNIETSTIVSIVLGIIVAVIGAYCKSLIKSLEDVKQHFEDYKKEDAAIEKLQDEKIITLETKKIESNKKLLQLEAMHEAHTMKCAVSEKKQDEKILTLENRQVQGLQKLSELDSSIKTDIKELSTKISTLSDVIIGLTGSIKHLEEKK